MKRLRKYLVILLIVGAGLTSITADALAGFRIERFHSEIAIDEDSSFTVIEEITVVFDAQHHGIFRDIPFRYRRDTGENFSVRMEVLEVTDERGRPRPYKVSRVGSNKRIRIGDPNVTVTGRQSYVIYYRVARALNYFDFHDEFYWNVTGTGWPVPIGRASAIITFPKSVEAVQLRCFAGAFQSTSEACTKRIIDDRTVAFGTADLGFNEGLTIVVGFDKGVVTPPSWTQEAAWFISDNWYVGIPLLTFLVLLGLWYREGKDPERGTIAPQFHPPAGLTPAEVGVIVDEHANLHDISATIIDLAIKGYLKIKEIRDDDEEDGESAWDPLEQEIESSSLGDREKRVLKSVVGARIKRLFNLTAPIDYRFEKLEEPGKDELNEFEKTILNAIFDGSKRKKLSDLKNQFYKDLAHIKEELYLTVVGKGYFTNDPDRVRKRYRGLAILGIFAGVASGIAFSSLYLGATVFVSGLLILAFAPLMPKKTIRGGRANQEILGLKEYIARAEKERIEFHNAPERTPEVFERLLPFAIALEVSDIWAEQFRDIYTTPPDWYEGRWGGFNSYYFYRSLTALNSDMQRTFVSSPSGSSSSGWSGGSGFSGGSVGGGFGGGGGGSW
ncbi:MAG: DUF2207 domain-containing protein [Candidatus Bipolaricaulia bacterium]